MRFTGPAPLRPDGDVGVEGGVAHPISVQHQRAFDGAGVCEAKERPAPFLARDDESLPGQATGVVGDAGEADARHFHKFPVAKFAERKERYEKAPRRFDAQRGRDVAVRLREFDGEICLALVRLDGPDEALLLQVPQVVFDGPVAEVGQTLDFTDVDAGGSCNDAVDAAPAVKLVGCSLVRRGADADSPSLLAAKEGKVEGDKGGDHAGG
jgi:hypothetical protein